MHCSMVHEAVFSEIPCRTQQSRFDYLVGMLTRHAPDINMAKVSGWVGGSVGGWVGQLVERGTYAG